ncbi:MAG: flavin reductase family protein, partial [Muribaculaceae bacterium]|nr:flavin reductase family protein [Muribaculaceae bacterium]
MKVNWKPGTMVYPLPAAIVTCGDAEESNMLTVAWTGTVCTNPPMLYISVRPERYSYGLIRHNMAFTVNLTTAAMARATDLAGVRSGRDCDKWQLCGL